MYLLLGRHSPGAQLTHDHEAAARERQRKAAMDSPVRYELRSALQQYRSQMPLTVFGSKGIPGTQRERIEAAIEAAGRHLTQPFEAWIAPIRFGAAPE